MTSKTIVIVSGIVDATIKEYQPDVEFKIFKTMDGLAEALEQNPIRAELLFFTKDVVAGAASTFSFLKDLTLNNDFFQVDRVIYITEEDSQELSSFNYLVEEFELSNWEVIKGPANRSFVQEVINGTYREDNLDVHRKVVIRRPRADYIKQQLKHQDSLEEEYTDDEHDLMDIPDEEIPEVDIEERPNILQKVYIAGRKCKERTAFAVLAAQYLARTDKVLLVESDPNYHLTTEFITKAKVPCSVITMTEIYDDISQAIERIVNADNNLVVIECIDRIPFDYKYMLSLLYYTLMTEFTYIICETDISELPYDTPVTVVIPSTVTDILATGELIDKSFVPYCRFVGVDLKELPETHISSGVVMSKILNDILTETNIICPVVTISGLRLGKSAYDLGGILGRGVLL
jgi:hypothetical protein